MDRRSFLKSASATAAGAGGLAAPAIAQDRQVVRMVTTWPRNFPGMGTGAQRVADRITAASGGRLEVKLFAAGELVPAMESFDAVASGAAEMYHGAEYYWAEKHPAFSFFAAVPLGFTAPELGAWIQFGGGQALWDELSGGFGVKAMLAGNTGGQMAGWFRNPVTSLDDLKGLKIRISGLGAAVMRAIGAEPVSLPGGEILPALQAGRIDAAQWFGPYNDLAAGFHQVLKHYVHPGFHEPGTGLSVGINREWWDRQTAADQVLLKACCDAENDVMLSEYTARNAESLGALLTEHGVSLDRFPDAVFAAIAEASAKVVAAVGNEDEIAGRIHASFEQFRRTVAPWSRVSNAAYLSARAATTGP